MSSNVYALFIWYHDDPITGNVMNISAVTEPRKEYCNYRVGEAVKARCGSFGVVPAIIGKIGGKDDKKDMEKLLKMPEAFTSLIDCFPEILVMRNENRENGLPPNPSDTLEKTVSKENRESGLPPNPSDTLEKTVSKEANEENAEHQEQMNNGPKVAKNQHVVKPKPIRRKIRLDGDGVRNPKALQSDAEDRALANIQMQKDIEQTALGKRDQSYSQLLGNSLELLNSTGMTPRKSPRRSPRKHNGTTEESHQPTNIPANQEADIERLEAENKDLQTRVGYLEYQTGLLWNELEQMKFHLGQMQTFRSPVQSPIDLMRMQSPLSHSATSAFSKPDSLEDTPMVEETTTPTNETSQNEPTYNGYIKSQIMELLDSFDNYKKGTAAVFRRVFTEDEIRGRSLTGGVSRDGTRRPAIEDKSKISFLEEVVKEKWPLISKDAVKVVLRDLLKPSRAKFLWRS